MGSGVVLKDMASITKACGKMASITDQALLSPRKARFVANIRMTKLKIRTLNQIDSSIREEDIGSYFLRKDNYSTKKVGLMNP